MNKIPVRIFIISIFAIALTALLLFYIDKSSFLQQIFRKPDTSKKQNDTFNSLVNSKVDKTQVDTRVPLKVLFDENGGDLIDKPDGQEIWSLGLGIVDFDFAVDWNFEKTPFWAQIVSVSPEASSMSVKFISPKSMPLLDQEKTVKMVGCETYNTFLTIENPETAQTGLDFFATYKQGDELVSYCLNNECTEAGKLCRLHRIQ